MSSIITPDVCHCLLLRKEETKDFSTSCCRMPYPVMKMKKIDPNDPHKALDIDLDKWVKLIYISPVKMVISWYIIVGMFVAHNVKRFILMAFLTSLGAVSVRIWLGPGHSSCFFSWPSTLCFLFSMHTHTQLFPLSMWQLVGNGWTQVSSTRASGCRLRFCLDRITLFPLLFCLPASLIIVAAGLTAEVLFFCPYYTMNICYAFGYLLPFLQQHCLFFTFL